MKKNLFNVFLVCVFCVAAIPDVFAQQIKVTGKVTDSTNEGMPGVNVQVKGTATGTITSNPQLSSSASFLRLNVLSSLN